MPLRSRNHQNWFQASKLASILNDPDIKPCSQQSGSVPDESQIETILSTNNGTIYWGNRTYKKESWEAEQHPVLLYGHCPKHIVRILLTLFVDLVQDPPLLRHLLLTCLQKLLGCSLCSERGRLRYCHFLKLPETIS